MALLEDDPAKQLVKVTQEEHRKLCELYMRVMFARAHNQGVKKTEKEYSKYAKSILFQHDIDKHELKDSKIVFEFVT